MAEQTLTTEQLIREGVLIIGDGYRAKNSELSRTGLPFARAGNIDGGFHFSDADRFPESELRRVGNKVSFPGDIVFTSKGTVGRFAFVRETTERFVYSPQLCFWRTLKPRHLHPRFLYYWMQSEQFADQVDAVKGQTDMADYVSLTDQRRMKITVPDIDLQLDVARLLGAIDDKIELNRSTNRTLETMAQALFKSWFVDFDPVQAKRDGRQPFGMDVATAALFPDHFEDSALGPIPKGWPIVPFTSFVQLLSGGTPKTGKPEYWNGSIPWFSIVDTPSPGDVFVTRTEKTITDLALRESATRLLEVGTTIVTARGTVGNLALTGVPMAMNQSCYGLRGKQGFGNYFVYFSTAHAVDELKQMTGGSVFDTIIRTTFDAVSFPRPSIDVINAFETWVSDWMRLIRSNVDESRTLATLRDTLLPKLLSGEIRLREAECAVEAVV